VKKQSKVYSLVQLIFLFLGFNVLAQNIEGVVLDQNKQPVFGATVILDGQQYTLTNEQGRFSYEVSPKVFNLKVQSLGFYTYQETKSCFRN